MQKRRFVILLILFLIMNSLLQVFTMKGKLLFFLAFVGGLVIVLVTDKFLSKKKYTNEETDSENTSEQEVLHFTAPCTIGDTVYDISNHKLDSYTIIGIRFGRMISEEKEVFKKRYNTREWYVECESNRGISMSFPLSKLGKKVFLSEEEANKKLTMIKKRG